MSGYRVAVDIGGTFTDIVVVKPDGEALVKKVSSTVGDYTSAIIEGLRAVFTQAGLDLTAVRDFRHGTTVASNTILEMKGARVGLIATKGFRDILQIGNLRMPRLYDLHWEKPAPLVERHLRLGVDERIDAQGRISRPLDIEDARAAVAKLIEDGVEAIAVCLINSYANAEHERQIAALAAEMAPDLPVCVSSDVLPQIKEHERTSTTVVNMYILPVVEAYLKKLERDLSAQGVEAPILLMQSNGSLASLREARARPVNIVESGPAAGVVGSVHHGARSGHDGIITFDMGGTTAKASMVEKGQFTLSQQYSVGGGIMQSSRLLTGGGYLLGVPAIDVVEVGAGGGSIVWMDAGGSMKVGPESAGSTPGPLCYDLGGDRPTVTDANLILGYLNPDALVSGELRLNAERARRIFTDAVARPLDLDLTTAAFAARQIAISNMIRAIRSVSSERGRDPRTFPLLAYGGNGPLFAAGMAHELGIRSVIVPPSAGVFSAVGLLHGDVGYYFTRTVRQLLRDMDHETYLEHWRSLEASAREQLAREGFDEASMRMERLANLRYRGQVYEISIPVDDALLHDAWPAATEARFGDEHERMYGHKAEEGHGVQLVSIQVLARAAADRDTALKWETRSRPAGAAERSREAYFGPESGWLDTPVLARADLATARKGPLIVEEYDTTCVVPPGAEAILDPHDNIVITLQ